MMKKNIFKSDNLFQKCILAIMVLMFCFVAAPLLAAEKDTIDNVNLSTLYNTSNKEVNSQVLEVPTLLLPVSNENEKIKLQRMAQFIKEKKPKLFKTNVQLKTIAFCTKFMEDLLQMRNIEAIEPDFVVSGTDEDIVKEEITKKLNVKHCEDMEHGSIIPPDVNPMLYRRGTLGFNYIGDLGGAPYRVYKLRLENKDKSKHTIIYYDAGQNWEHVHTGFARLDLKKCEIKDDKGGYSEIEKRSQSLVEIGRNALVTYKGQVIALMLKYSSTMTSDNYRLDLFQMSIPITKGSVCHWSYDNYEKQEPKK